MDLLTLDCELVAVSNGTLEEDSDGEWQLLKSLVLQVEEAVVFVGLVSNCEFLEAVGKWVSLHIFESSLLNK